MTQTPRPSAAAMQRCSFLFGAMLLCSAPAFAQAQQATPAAQATPATPAQHAKPAPHATHATPAPRHMQQSVEATATLSAIDVATRTLTLKLDDGTTTEIVAGPEVKRFGEFAVGDKVHARYTLGVTTELRAPTDAEKADPLVVVEGGARAPGDAAPAAGAGRMIRVVATIEAIDRAKHEVTLKGPNGNSMLIEVRDPSALEAPKVGDTVVVTIAESVALSLEKVGGAKKAKTAKK